MKDFNRDGKHVATSCSLSNAWGGQAGSLSLRRYRRHGALPLFPSPALTYIHPFLGRLWLCESSLTGTVNAPALHLDHGDRRPRPWIRHLARTDATAGLVLRA